MAKKKSRSTKAAKKTEALTDMQELAVRAGRLLAGETDGSPEAIGALIRERLCMGKADLARIQSGDLLPSEEQAALLQGFADANEGKDPGDPVADRSKPTPKESKLLDRVQALEAMTAQAAWRELVVWLNGVDAALTRSLRDCKPSELRGIQGQIEAFDSLRDRVLAPVEEFAELPLFAKGYVVKADRKALTVTLGAR